MNQETIRVLVADRARARVFAADNASGDLREVEDFVNPDLAPREQDLTTDKPGRAFDSGGQGRHSMEQKTTPKTSAMQRFAGMLADKLEQGRASGRYERLGLVAEPAMLGALRQGLSDATSRMLVLELDKNLVKLDAKTLRGHLPKKLFSAAAS